MDLAQVQEAGVGEVTVTVRDIAKQGSMKSKFGDKSDKKVLDIVVSDSSDTREISVIDPTFDPKIGDKVRMSVKVNKKGNAVYWNGSKMRKIYDEPTPEQQHENASKEQDRALVREQNALLKKQVDILSQLVKPSAGNAPVGESPTVMSKEIAEMLIGWANDMSKPGNITRIQQEIIDIAQKYL